MKSIFFKNIVAAVICTLIFCGCAYKVNVSEVLQQPVDSKLRTNYHLWYTNAEKISPLNYMEGSFIPAGTEIEPIEVKRGTYDIWGSVSVVDGSIKFRTLPDGKEYTIFYDQHLTMTPIEDFIRQFISIKPVSEIYKNVPKNELAAVKAGKLKKNMHLNSVLVLLGPPAKSRTSKLTNQSWLYWKNQDTVFRLIFRGNKIRQIGSLDKLDF